jgi:hypothetical protein
MIKNASVNQSTSSFFPPPPASQSPSRTHRATPVAPPTPIPHSNTIPSVAPAPTAAPGLSSKFKLSRSIKAVPSPQAQPGAVVDPVRDGQTTSPFSAIATTTTITGLKDLKNPAQTSSNTMLPPPARISRSTSKEVNRSIHHSNTIETMGRTIHTATNATDNEASGNEIEGAFKKPTGRPRSASRSISKEKHRVQDEERDSSDGRNNERFDQLPQRGINYQEFNPIGIDTTTGYNHERDQFGTSQFEDPLTQLGKNNNNNNHNDQQETGGMSSQQRQDELDDDLNALNNDTEMIGGRGEKRGRDYDHGRNDDDRDNRDQESLNQEDDGGNSRGKEKRMRSQVGLNYSTRKIFADWQVTSCYRHWDCKVKTTIKLSIMIITSKSSITTRINSNLSTKVILILIPLAIKLIIITNSLALRSIPSINPRKTNHLLSPPSLNASLVLSLIFKKQWLSLRDIVLN